MGLREFEQKLKETLEAVPVIDPHCHLGSDHPHATSLADILLYHHVWIELVSAGMPATAVSKHGLPHELINPDIPPAERVKACLPYLPRIRNTLCMKFLRWILEDLYGVPGGQLTERNWEEVAHRIEQTAADPGWGLEFLRKRCGIQSAISVESGEITGQPLIAKKNGRQEQIPQIAVGRELTQYITLDSGKMTPQHALRSLMMMWRQTGWIRSGKPLTADIFAENIERQVRQVATSKLRFIGVWIPAYLRLMDPSGQAVNRVLKRAQEGGELLRGELRCITSFALRRMLSAVRKTNVRTIQVIVGAEVLLPHRSIPQWDGSFVGAVARLANTFSDLHFDVSAACDVYLHDLAILAKHMPNVSVSGYWWHALYPSLIRKSIELRLDAVPADKITAFFSDAYHAEWCYPKLKLVKQIFHQILLERVATGWYDEETALSLVRPLFYDNPLRIYFGATAT